MATVSRYDFAVAAKVCALAVVLPAVFLLPKPNWTAFLAALGFVFLLAQRQWRQLWQFAAFYGVLCLFLYLIRQHGLRMLVFSEFHVFLFWYTMPVFLLGWNLITSPPGNISAFLSRLKVPTPLILGVLVVFRFFPTMRAECAALRESMHNRGLLAGGQILRHPLRFFEYVLVPLLLRCLQIADQLAVSAVARGVETPGARTSYHGKPMALWDWACIAVWIVSVAVLLVVGGVG